jgi:hypothetical protein
VTSASDVSEPSGSHSADIGWARAIATGLGLLAVGVVAAVVGANEILTRFTGISRSARQWLATAVFFAVVVIMAWVLRRLQRKLLI